MKLAIYWNLALSGIKKNRRLYLPYIFTCIGAVMMSYIISFLSTLSAFADMKGGDNILMVLGLGVVVMGVFSFIFLFYTNSFLVRRRKKEFGLYNILGVGKRHLGIVLLLETVMLAAISLTGGLFFGILFSKLAELCMIKILGGAATFSFSIGLKSIRSTLILFTAIFGVIYLNTLWQIQLTNPIALLHSENVGEKPPKANWVVAILGIAMLVTAYFLAVTIKDPVAAINMFFIAVILVVVATYLLFIAGSVALCRLLQKNKCYYYKTNHFVSVSSMVYRMKRNGAGLASICILCTMVLVMISSTVCLYIGREDSLRSQYPRHINLESEVRNVAQLGGDNIQKMQKLTEQLISENNLEQENVLQLSMATYMGLLEGQQFILDDKVMNGQTVDQSKLWLVVLIPLSDYNRLMDTEEVLAPGEAILYVSGTKQYTGESIYLGDKVSLNIVKQVKHFALDTSQILPSVYLFVPDLEAAVEPLAQTALTWYYGFDLSCSDEEQIEITRQLAEKVGQLEAEMEESEAFHTRVQDVASRRVYFYATYGGLFFLGILLGIVFTFAAVLIIYYKQVSEGYEDRSRFEIMRKVGMTTKEIKKSINSQVLTIFFMPIITAGIHLGFAFPFIQKWLLIFGVINLPLLLATTLCSYVVFLLFYVVVFQMTSRAYLSIVNDSKEDLA